MRTLLAGLLVLATAAAAALAPLWTYALSLALFGLPHVVTELRYVDERFAARLPRRTFAWLALGLAAIVALRLGALGGLGSSADRTVAELLVGAGLVAAVLPQLQPRSNPVAITLIVTLLLGAAFAPVALLVGLALLHNLTPVGFLAERLQGRKRQRALAVSAVVFGLVPLGLLWFEVPGLLVSGPFDTGDLDLHLPAFVPPPLLGTAFADRLFAAAAYLQCMHYATVLHVLPALSGGSETIGARFAWPSRAAFVVATAGIGLLFTLGFSLHFAETRSIYAVFAALHAWLEIPILALACGVTARYASAAAAP